MVFFLTSCHLAYELCLDSYLETKLDAFDEKNTYFAYLVGEMGGECIFASVLICAVRFLSNTWKKLFSILSENKCTYCIDLRKSNPKLYLVLRGGKAVGHFSFAGGNA